MKKFVLIESNTTGSGQLCLRKALLRGFEVLFLTNRPQAYRFLREEMVTPVIVDTSDPQQIARVLEPHVDVIAGVFSTSEYYIGIAAEIASRFGLPGADPEAISICRDKGRLYHRLRNAGIGTTDTVVVASLGLLRELAGSLDYPVVIKPATGSGSVGVRLIHAADELLEHGGRILRTHRNERGLPVEPRLLVQAYVDGPEFSVEVIGLGPTQGYAVLGVTAKRLGPLPHFVEYGHDFPAKLDVRWREALIADTLKALDVVGHRFGPAHVECRVSHGRTMVIEINPRLAGGMIPYAIECATGIDVLGAIVDLHVGVTPEVSPARSGHAAIRFILPPRSGRLRQLTWSAAGVCPEVRMTFMPLCENGQNIDLQGDFRDRIGVVIAAGDDLTQLAQALEEVSERVTVIIDDPQPDDARNNTGRLRSELHPEAQAVVRKLPARAERLRELKDFAAIDEAHLLMLAVAGIGERKRIAAALAEIGRQRNAGFATLLDMVAPRGAYALYEQDLLNRLGTQTGGMIHTARSRNDIQACVAKLEMRRWFNDCSQALWRLRAALLERAQTSLALNLPVYSQYQAAQPGSLAYYLWSVECALRRDQHAWFALIDELNVCPLGAGAGAGTDFPILPALTAALLGFSRSFDSALDAVASRDGIMRFLSGLAIAATTLSRLAQDLQLWTMQEMNFVTLPDNLSGGSSLLPQKKNPYLLEMAKGRFAQVAGVLNIALFTAQRTPFSNSVEVGTEAVSQCSDAVRAFDEGCALLRLIVEGLSGNDENMRNAAAQGRVVAAQVANQLVREQAVSFHDAHQRVGALISQAVEQRRDPLAALEGLTQLACGEIETAREALRYGGGPGTAAAGLVKAGATLQDDARRLWACRSGWWAARVRRREQVAALLHASGAEGVPQRDLSFAADNS